jgi:hypothetical protein
MKKDGIWWKWPASKEEYKGKESQRVIRSQPAQALGPLLQPPDLHLEALCGNKGNHMFAKRSHVAKAMKDELVDDS